MKIVYMIGTRSKTINKPQERKAVQNNNRTNTGSTQKMAETTLTKHPSIKRVSNLVKMQGWESVLFSKHSAKTSSTMTIQKMQREYQILNSLKTDLQIELMQAYQPLVNNFYSSVKSATKTVRTGILRCSVLCQPPRQMIKND